MKLKEIFHFFRHFCSLSCCLFENWWILIVPWNHKEISQWSFWRLPILSLSIDLVDHHCYDTRQWSYWKLDNSLRFLTTLISQFSLCGSLKVCKLKLNNTFKCRKCKEERKKIVSSTATSAWPLGWNFLSWASISITQCSSRCWWWSPLGCSFTKLRSTHSLDTR